MSNDQTTIGFLGTGVMGAPMVRRLLGAGFAVRVWNRNAARAEPLSAAGAVRADSPAGAVEGVDVALSCLADAAALDSTLFSKGGFADAARPPARLVDFSTLGPESTLTLASRLHARCGTSWVDAPVSGGAQGAEQGRLVIFCGGTVADIDRAQPIFAALAQRVTRVGELGAGQTLKLCNQLIVGANLAAIAEALALARANGLKPELLPEAFAGGFADSLPLQIFGRRMAAGIREPVIGQLGLMLKDFRATAELARRGELSLPLLEAALDVYRTASDRGLAHADLSTLLDLYPKSANPPASA